MIPHMANNRFLRTGRNVHFAGTTMEKFSEWCSTPGDWTGATLANYFVRTISWSKMVLAYWQVELLESLQKRVIPVKVFGIAPFLPIW